jgi:hypothetical protein
LSLDGLTGAVQGGELEVLHVVLYRRVSVAFPRDEAAVPAAGAEAQRRAGAAADRDVIPLMQLEKDSVAS